MLIQIVAGSPVAGLSVHGAGNDIAGITVEARNGGSIIINLDDGDSEEEGRRQAAVRLSIGQAEVLIVALAAIVKECKGVS